MCADSRPPLPASRWRLLSGLLASRWRLLSGLLGFFATTLLASLARGDLGMQVSKLPLWKAIDTPFFSLEGSHIELFALLFMFMSTLVVMSVRWQRQLIRHLVQLVSLVVFFYIVFSCLGVFGMIRNTIHGIGLIGTVHTESFFWISLPVCILAFSLTTGPFFCGWICPTGTIQELVAMVREAVTRRRQLAPGGLSLTLIGLFFAGFLTLVFQISHERKLFVEDSSLYWAASIIVITFMVLTGLASDLATRALRGVSLIIILSSAIFQTVITSPVHFAFVDVLDPASAITTLVLAVASVFIARSWCRYICPWGMVMSLLQRYARLRVQVTGDCTACGKCVAACRVGAVEPGHVRWEHCQHCLACVDACPAGNISIVDQWLARPLPAPSKSARRGAAE